ncbi:unnamed protein product [Rotaria sp. Silwood1]|nr:unnamed protein product [Rotaria sp. Silwood1]
MIDRGAPFDDVNNNGNFDIGIDIPGVKNAAQTIFICMTDGFPENHSIAEGFSGGTQPLFAEVSVSAWQYDNPGYEDIQFIKYHIINKSLVEWKKSYFSMFIHSQIGDSLDDYVGCDTVRRLGYTYNRDNQDGTGSGNSYGAAPPAVGMTLLHDNMGLGMTSFHYVVPMQIEIDPACEEFPYNPMDAYNYMRGYKKDGTPWLDATSISPKQTKYTFPGDPETNTGWTEYNGIIGNCNGALTGNVVPNYSRQRTFMMSTGSETNNLPCPSFIDFHYAQLVARGSDNKNSVTKLKLLSAEALSSLTNSSSPYEVIREQTILNANNISTWVWNTGVFNHDLRTTNTPGFEWPKGSGKFAIFSTGLTIGAYVNNDLRLAAISNEGEYAPGYSSAGIAYTTPNFKLYKIKRSDNFSNSSDYTNWSLMVPFGAPYIDIDGNGQFNPLIDMPGVKGAGQTIFECITDGFPENHTTSEGFSGGTLPLYSEMHLTAWSYDTIPQLTDVQFFKMEVINKNSWKWDSTFFGIVCDADLGYPTDDYIGCDTTRKLGYCYNSTDPDGSWSPYGYGAHPPAVGIDLLKGAHSQTNDIGLSSAIYYTSTGSSGIVCEQDPNSQPITAYNYLKGYKKDGTPWLNPLTSPPAITKFCYPGDPETNTGWTEYSGMIKNCGGVTTGAVEGSPPGDRRFILNSGALNFHVNPSDTQTILDDFVQTVYDNNFVISVNPISSEVPDKFLLTDKVDALPSLTNSSLPYAVIREQTILNANNISTWIQNTGTFNQDIRTNNTPGFEWPKGSGKFAVFTSGLSLGAYINNELRLATISYVGEYAPGYSSAGIAYTTPNFKLYKIKRGDNFSNSSDYTNWGLMVPFGAPYIDVDGNGQFNPLIDMPGIKGAGQTIFECITDGFPDNHTSSEGFSGGTTPLFSEMHLTAWSYDTIPQLTDVQFLKMEVINKNNSPWNKTYFGLICDPDLGDWSDDRRGCDTNRSLAYCYNGDNQDGNGSGRTYGTNPPSVGFDILRGAINNNTNAPIKMSSFNYYLRSGGGEPPTCEFPPSTPIEAYNYMKGLKKDGTSYINPLTLQTTKYNFTGNPETGEGWTEFNGRIANCGGTLTDSIIPLNAYDVHFMQNSGAEDLTIASGEKQTFIFAQMIARGNNNLNSVTKLKQLDDFVQTVYDNNFVIAINPISNEVPDKFLLRQNYPNPFNPETTIKFEIPQNDFVNLSVYDLNGRLIEELVNEKLFGGTYEVNFTAKNLSSGIYFYKLLSSSFTETRRMILVK